MKSVIFLAALLCLPPSARAQLEPELDTPYRLQVVLHVADNRFLTHVFQEQLQRALRDRLQLSLGALANVEVVRAHPLLGTVESKGLESGLDGWEQISPVQTHFVLVDFANGMYSLKARQYDGMTGLESPAPRQAQTSERGLVAELAARLVRQDFGLVGTVVEAGKEVRLALKGGKLATRLERWLKPGEVFAVSRITRAGDRLRGSRVPWTLLEALDTPQGGICRCRLWHRFQEDDLRDQPGVLGYRCLKIATTPGPLKLRLIDDEQFRPLEGLQVHVLAPGSAKPAELTTNRDGLLVTRDSYPHLALVRVLSGDTVRAQFPVELTGDRTVVCRLKIQPDAEAQAPVEFRKDQWLRRILDNLRLASERVALLNRELNDSMETALETAKAGVKSIAVEIDYLMLERDQILRQAREKSAKLGLRDGEAGLGALRKKKEDLEGFVVRIEKALHESKSDLGLAKLLERARLLEGEADFDQAIALYERVLKESPEQPKVKEHLAQLKADWAPKNAKHKEARAFLVGFWPTLDVAELKKENFDKAHGALAVCREAHDKLTPLKVMHANVVHAANLKKHLDALKRQDSDDNRTQAKVVAQVADSLRRLHAEAKALAGKTKNE
jgi:tetratricopeptide (TPR) repeat protein